MTTFPSEYIFGCIVFVAIMILVFAVGRKPKKQFVKKKSRLDWSKVIDRI